MLSVAVVVTQPLPTVRPHLLFREAVPPENSGQESGSSSNLQFEDQRRWNLHDQINRPNNLSSETRKVKIEGGEWQVADYETRNPPLATRLSLYHLTVNQVPRDPILAGEGLQPTLAHRTNFPASRSARPL